MSEVVNKLDVHFSSGKDDWETPDDLFAELDSEFHFDMDLCATEHNTKCDNWSEAVQYITGFDDPTICWMNPPYSRNLQYQCVSQAKLIAKNGTTVVCLLPARTDTYLFHDFIWDRENHKPQKGVEVRFLKGRIKFKGAKNPAPFPSMIVIFRGERLFG